MNFAKERSFELTMNSIHDVDAPIRVLVPQTFKYELEETY